MTIQEAPYWLTASSAPNALVGPGGAGATGYTLVLPSAVTSITFSRLGPSAPTSVAAWTATALNASGQTVASVGEPQTCCTFAARSFTLSGVGITSVRITSGGCSCGIQSPWIDDLTLSPALVTSSPAGAFVATWGSAGSGDGQFSGPVGIAVDGSNVYVADSGNDRIQKFVAGSES